MWLQDNQSSQITIHWSGERLTDAFSTWLTPCPIRKTVNVLKAIQLESSIALELLILTKVIILLRFLSEEEVHKYQLGSSTEGCKYKPSRASFSLYSTCHSTSTLAPLHLSVLCPWGKILIHDTTMTCSKGPQTGVKHMPLQWGQSLSTWDACSNH